MKFSKVLAAFAIVLMLGGFTAINPGSQVAMAADTHFDSDADSPNVGSIPFEERGRAVQSPSVERDEFGRRVSPYPPYHQPTR
jgi:hypothetical protein